MNSLQPQKLDFCWSYPACVTISTVEEFSRTRLLLPSSCCATCQIFVMLLRNRIQRHVSDRAAPSSRCCHAAFRVPPTPFSQHAQQRCALKIHVLCLHLESRRLVRVSSTGVRDGIPNGRSLGVFLAPRKDRGQWCLSAGTETLLSGGGGGASVNFLHCGVGTIIFYSTGFQTPSDNNTKAAAPAQ